MTQAFAPGGDPDYFKSIQVRFAATVLPGDTLVTEMWTDGNKVILRSKIKERGEICISNAAVELWTELPPMRALGAIDSSMCFRPAGPRLVSHPG